MKETALGIVLSLITLFLISFIGEKGDINAMSMYFVVFLFPVLFIPIVNGLILMKIEISEIGLKSKRALSVVPIIILAFIALSNHVRIPSIDGDISFIGVVGIIAIGLTNLYWNYKLK